MHLPKTVTAQDFYDEFHAHNDLPGVFFPDECEKGIDALLSQARQEARREALKEMDEAWQTLEYATDTKNVKEQKLETRFIEKLRQEYLQPN